MKTLLFLTLALLPPITDAAAWDDYGHMIVAASAYDQLTPRVRDTVIELLRLNPQYATWVAGIPEDEKPRVAFLRASRWADDIKRDPAYEEDGSDGGNRPSGPNAARNVGYADTLMHKYWHFIDLPFSPDGTALLDPPIPNAKTQIALFRETLRSPTATNDLKSYDLVWLMHLVADVHQPLHATSRFDKAHVMGDDGGNGVLACSSPCQRQEKLHAFWDHILGVSTDTATATEQAKQLPEADPQLASIGDEAVWIQESFEAAQQHVYVSPIEVGVGPYEVTDGYITRARELAAQRMALAGARLAHLLNQALNQCLR
ncbi:MAG TPA: S1/P1 nuclease [Nitrospiraceae bacterium]